MLVVAAAVVCLVSAVFWWLLKPSHSRQLLAKIPGPTPLPIIGNALQFKADTAEFVKQIYDYCDKYGPIYKLMFGPLALVIVCSPSSAEKILSSMRILRKNFAYLYLEPWLNKGLLTSTGAKWQSRRKLLTPTFHFKILTDFLHVFNENAQGLVARLEEFCDKDPVDIFPIITLCTLDTICETAMGKKINAQNSDENSTYVNALLGMSDIVMVRFRSPWQWPDFLFKRTERGRRHEQYLKVLHGFTRQVIDERIKEMEDNPEEFFGSADGEESSIGKKKRRAFLDLLLYMAKEANFTKDDIQEEVDTFMFEGHDTTASGISWTIQLIGSHPEVQEKLHEEIDGVFGDSDRPATSEDLNSMKYLECVIKESLRVLPPVTMIGRTADEDTDIGGGMTIPKGASVMVMLKKTGQESKHFPDWDVFDPDRFLPENTTGRNPYAYIPFSAGPRNCIGQRFALNELKCVVSTLLRTFDLEATQTIEETRPIPDLILRPENGIKIKIKRRKI